MQNFMSEYAEKWIRQAQHIKKGVQKLSPNAWGFVSFVLPLMAVPVAVKGAQMAGKAIKKEIDKKKR